MPQAAGGDRGDHGRFFVARLGRERGLGIAQRLGVVLRPQLHAGLGGGLQGADGEDISAGGAMRQLEELAHTGQHDRVIPDDVAAADRMESDLLIRPLTRHTGPAIHLRILQIPAIAFCSRTAQHESRAAG